MRLPLRLALRYLVKRRSSTMVHLISGISVLVIAAVTAAMICILSAFNGIEDLVKTLFGTLDADLAVVPVTGQVLPESWGTRLDSLEGVAAWTAVLEDECVARDGETVRVASLLGVRADYPSVAPIDQAVVEGEYMVGGNDLGVSCACLGLGVRSELGISSDELEPPVFSLSAPIRGTAVVHLPRTGVPNHPHARLRDVLHQRRFGHPLPDGAPQGCAIPPCQGR